MIGSSGVTRCIVHDGAVWMHLDNTRVLIPSHLLNGSELLVNALSSVDECSGTNEFTLPAPKEWLQAWMACYGGEEELLRCAGTTDLVNCLLVCFQLVECILQRSDNCSIVCTYLCCVHCLSSARLCACSPIDSLRSILRFNPQSKALRLCVLAKIIIMVPF
jgi:hypothetical protein